MRPGNTGRFFVSPPQWPQSRSPKPQPAATAQNIRSATARQFYGSSPANLTMLRKRIDDGQAGRDFRTLTLHSEQLRRKLAALEPAAQESAARRPCLDRADASQACQDTA